MSENPYEDIINLPHHVSAAYSQMSVTNRAVQFLPFAALTGYDAAIKETARLTEERVELDEYAVDALSMKLRILADMTDEHPTISVTYFQADERKSGGAYVTVSGSLKKIDEYEGIVVLTNRKKIKIGDILDVECKLFTEEPI